MAYSQTRIAEILAVRSAALPATLATVTGGSGSDPLDGAWSSPGGGGNQVVITNVAVLGELGNDTLDGGSGNDALYPGPGDDDVLGGIGTDAVAFVDSDGPVTVDLASGYANEDNGDLDSISDVENVLGSEAGDHIYGDGLGNVLDGWEGDDTISGRAGDDDLRGGDGDDVLDGGLDDDTILDGDGRDELIGGDGDDTLLADAGDDLLEGGDGDDLIAGGSGSDTASYWNATAAVVVSLNLQGGSQNTGGAGWDELWSIENLKGGALNDWLFGDGFANTLEGVEGDDHLYGNEGDDLLRGGPGADHLDGGEGIDRASYFYATGGVTASLSTGTASGAHGNDAFDDIEELGGGAYADTLTGDDGANLLLGAGGDDLLRGGLGHDVLDGGIGRDTASWWLSSGQVTANLTTGFATGVAGIDTLIAIENLVGTNGFADMLTGDLGVNRLEGWGGDDVLRGNAGVDTLNGGAGFDSATYAHAADSVFVDLGAGEASGADDADTLIGIERALGSDHSDTLIGSAVANTLEGGGGDDLIRGKGGNDVLDGGADQDWVDYINAGAAVAVDLAAGIATGGAGTDSLANFENAQGSMAHDDELSGDDEDNILQGFDGNDTLRGRGGNDLLDGNWGTDRAVYDDSPGYMMVNLAAGTASGAAGTDTLVAIEDVTGSAFSDWLIGDANANHLEGADNNDLIEGGAGDDVLDGGAGIDTVSFEGATSFVLADLTYEESAFGAGYDSLIDFEDITGSADWGDQLIGNGGANTLRGLGGDDTLVGLFGSDRLEGGAGADIFMFNATSDAGAGFAVLEEITDFVSGSGDLIHLAHIDTDAATAGDQGFNFIGGAGFSGDGTAEVRFINDVLFADSNGNGSAEMAIRLTGVTAVVAGDLLL